MSGRIEARLGELGIELPEPTAPMANYVPFTVAGSLVFIAGQIMPVERRAPPCRQARRRDRRRRGARRGAAVRAQHPDASAHRLRRRSRPGQPRCPAARLCQLHAGVHRHAASRQRRVRSDGRDLRRSRAPCARGGRRRVAAGRRGGRGRRRFSRSAERAERGGERNGRGRTDFRDRAWRDSRDPGGGMGCLRRRGQPDRVARLSRHPRTERLGDGARRLGAAAPGARRTRRSALSARCRCI